ncbi:MULTISPECIES: hypothetical protein [unclassified Polaromonas]|uniref:hypothetical protein n=1 Tax=unclassified Polaromonas TaxID=2638319 RepID=UPI000F090EA6|nr:MULTISPECIES: hypothetical protein [unclassified Polaromonas]AYQ29551.1 hypothetical protein DT070_16930 [Polaromonas sp. SP1]QGJ19333.1 hypothetical protein F7R28_13655 [Polaromonas sp. Pch-P]
MIFFSGNGFARLQLDESATERDVKRAYARELKLIDPATQAQAFADLRQDYENALAHVRFTAEFAASAQDFGHTGEEGAPGQDADKGEEAAEMRTNVEEEPRPAQAPEPEPEPLVAAGQAQSQASAPGPAPQELPRHLPFDSFAETLTFSPSDLPAAQAALRRWLAQDELMLMAAREAFEFELMEALGSRRFGQRTAVLFLAASQAFYWDSGRHSQLERMGHVGSYISSLLYEMAVLDAPSQWRWLALTEAPDPKMALTLLNDAERMESLSPALARLFFADGHIEAWREARDHAPLLQRGSKRFVTLFKTSAALRGGLLLLVVPVVLVIMSSLLSVAQKKEATRASALCDGYFASAMARNWKDMPLSDITQLENCARGVPPLLCSDRAAMQDVLGIAKSVQGSRYYTYDVNGMQVNLSDGRRFGGAPSTGCSSVMSFATSASWLNQGDEKAAKQLVADVARCSAIDSNRMESSALLTLLAQTDAWPAPVTGRPGKSIALSSLLITAPNAAPLVTSPNPAPAAPYKPWPACAAAMSDDLKLRMGEKEWSAASTRANHSGELALRKILAGATSLSDAELAAAAAAAVAATAGR